MYIKGLENAKTNLKQSKQENNTYNSVQANILIFFRKNSYLVLQCYRIIKQKNVSKKNKTTNNSFTLFIKQLQKISSNGVA